MANFFAMKLIDWFEAQKAEGGKYAPPFGMFGLERRCINFKHMIFLSTVAESSARSSSKCVIFDNLLKF